MNRLYLDIIKEKCYDKNGNIISHCNKKTWWDKKDISNIYEDILNYTDFLSAESFMRQRLYHYTNDIKYIPICNYTECNNNVKWQKSYYAEYCSTKCTSRSTLEKRKKTCIEKYGFDNPSKSEIIKNKIKETNLEKYGVDNYSLTPEFSLYIKEKWNENKEDWLEQRKLNLEKYGYIYPFENNEILEKSKKTMYKKYGTCNPLQVPEINKKMKETNIKRYGTSSFLQKDISYEFLDNRNNKMFFENLLKNYSLKDLSTRFKISYSLLCQNLNKLGIDIKKYYNNETEIYNYLNEQIDSKIIRNDRKILNGKEIDIYIPEYLLAIEHNGTYWHSDRLISDKQYHLKKTLKCLENNIQLLHIFENEWKFKRDILKSIINVKIKNTKKIYARNCVIKKIDKTQEKIFLNKTHIQGYYPSTLSYGLFFEDKLVQIISFEKSRFNKSYEWKLLRLSSELNTVVVGGANKLYKKFIKDLNPISVISYCDLRFFDGNTYEFLGFKFSHLSEPNYYYVDQYGNLHSRYKFQKHKLKNKLKIYDDNLSEDKNMKNNGYNKIYDCGNKVFIWKSS